MRGRCPSGRDFGGVLDSVLDRQAPNLQELAERVPCWHSPNWGLDFQACNAGDPVQINAAFARRRFQSSIGPCFLAGDRRRGRGADRRALTVTRKSSGI